MKSKALTVAAIAGFILISFAASSPDELSNGVSNCLAHYNKSLTLFMASNQRLNEAVKAIDKNAASVVKAREALKACRLEYKKIEFFTSYFFPSETRFYNAAPKFEVEEPTLELVEPMGLQQIETLLFASDVQANKPELLAQTEAMLTSARDLHALLFGFEANDAQILESLRISLIRLSVLSVSGYDAPFLKTGIAETAVATEALQTVLQPYMLINPAAGKPVNDLLTSSLTYLRARSNFDSFNRMEYLVKFALPLQKQLGLFIKILGLEINTTRYLNYQAESIYSKNALKHWNSNLPDNAKLVALGKALFFDKSLSGNSAMSCASCHRPEYYFSDPVPKSPSLQPGVSLKRNTPTLFYSGRQHSQFWDGRATGLLSQVHEVIFNPIEMDGKEEYLNKELLSTEKYRSLCEAAYPNGHDKETGVNKIAEALTAFVQNLEPMKSDFDTYIGGDHSAMNAEQIKGFNLFMGKAQCGTCHFPPYFNSLLPPFFDISEVEILGTPGTDNFKKPETDPDRGRQNLYNIRYYKNAFKTPTVRNSAKTAPYMHNGSFKSLNKVLEFYNRGGGQGIGLTIEDQTLSAKPLNLTKREMNYIISFLESLTDPIYQLH